MKSPWSVSRMGENRTSGLMSGGVETGPLKDTAPPLDSTKLSTTLRNLGTGAGIVRCATLQGVDPASPAHRLETRTSTRPSFARHKIFETSRLEVRRGQAFIFNMETCQKSTTDPEGGGGSEISSLIVLYASFCGEIRFTLFTPKSGKSVKKPSTRVCLRKFAVKAIKSEPSGTVSFLKV